MGATPFWWPFPSLPSSSAATLFIYILTSNHENQWSPKRTDTVDMMMGVGPCFPWWQQSMCRLNLLWLLPAGLRWPLADMDTTTSIKMTTLAIQNLFGYVEEENLAALKAHLDRFKEVDGRSDVRQRVFLSNSLSLASCSLTQFLCSLTEWPDSSHAGGWTGQPGDPSGAHQERSQCKSGWCGEPLFCLQSKLGSLDLFLWRPRVLVARQVEDVSMVTWGCVCCQDCWSALISAAKEGHVDVVKELLENSAYVEHRDMVRHTHSQAIGADQGQRSFIGLLFQGGWTALMWAAYKGRVDVTLLLLEHGANANTTGQVTHTHSSTLCDTGSYLLNELCLPVWLTV